MTRESWESYFMGIARVVAGRSTCSRRHVGAVAVRDKRVLATGYNGAPRGVPHCLDVGCLREQMGIPSGERHELCRGLHAEQNVIIQAALHGVSLQDAVIYCTHQPCLICAKMLINSGFRHVYCLERYADALSEDMMLQAGLTLTMIKA